MKRYLAALLALLLFAGLLSACQSAAPERAGPTLKLTEQWWTGFSKEQPAPKESSFPNVAPGTVIYEDEYYGTITVQRVNALRITLQIENSSFINKKSTGTVNLWAKPLQSLTILRGQEKEIATATMDGGVTLKIKYE